MGIRGGGGARWWNFNYNLGPRIVGEGGIGGGTDNGDSYKYDGEYDGRSKEGRRRVLYISLTCYGEIAMITFINVSDDQYIKDSGSCAR